MLYHSPSNVRRTNVRTDPYHSDSNLEPDNQTTSGIMPLDNVHGCDGRGSTDNCIYNWSVDAAISVAAAQY